MILIMFWIDPDEAKFYDIQLCMCRLDQLLTPFMTKEQTRGMELWKWFHQSKIAYDSEYTFIYKKN